MTNGNTAYNGDSQNCAYTTHDNQQVDVTNENNVQWPRRLRNQRRNRQRPLQYQRERCYRRLEWQVRQVDYKHVEDNDDDDQVDIEFSYVDWKIA